MKCEWFGSALLIAVVASTAAAAGDVKQCWTLENAERLQCYDKASGRPEAPRESSGRMTGYLAQRWGYDLPPRENRFVVRQYNDNYLILRDSNSPNANPHAPAPPPAVPGTENFAMVPIDVDHPEVKLQISAKLRLLDFSANSLASGSKVDDAFGLWLGYTQQSHWQLLNSTQSSPFRETNYQPEAIISMHPWLFIDSTPPGDSGWNWRLFNLGVGHQSNGQGGSLSRSRNYAFAQLGFETDNDHGQWSVVLRPWYRFRESASTDDNRDLTDYIGYGDVRATWRKCDYEVSLMGRGNPSTGKGAAQLDLSLPLLPWGTSKYYPLQWYVQVFAGYGESLIDYNWRQTTVGFGVRMTDRQPGERTCAPKTSRAPEP